MQQFVRQDVPPPWFAAAVAAALETALPAVLEPIHRRLNIIEARLINACNRTYTDVLEPPQHGLKPPPKCCPRSRDALLELSDRRLSKIETYYELPHDGDNIERIIRILGKYGIHK